MQRVCYKMGYFMHMDLMLRGVDKRMQIGQVCHMIKDQQVVMFSALIVEQ